MVAVSCCRKHIPSPVVEKTLVLRVMLGKPFEAVVEVVGEVQLLDLAKHMTWEASLKAPFASRTRTPRILQMISCAGDLSCKEYDSHPTLARLANAACLPSFR